MGPATGPVIAVDSNLLVYAHRTDSEFHERASRLLQQLGEGRAAWAIPWPCIYEFLGIVTRPRVYEPPTSLDRALDQVDAWLQSPAVTLLAETSDHWPTIRQLLADGRVTGPRVHDAKIAALCQLHGVTELWTADRDFSRFPGLRTRNPLVG